MDTGARRQATDADLLVSVADGDRLALRELYERHAPWLVARLRHRCGDSTVVHDSVQDTFMAVWKGASGYDGRGDVAAWIWGIGVRRLIGQLRKSPLPTVPLLDHHGDDAMLLSAEEQVLISVEHGDLAGALNQLSPELRSVVQATVLDGLTTREASKLLGIPAGTVKTRMMRARIELRGSLA